MLVCVLIDLIVICLTMNTEDKHLRFKSEFSGFYTKQKTLQLRVEEAKLQEQMAACWQIESIGCYDAWIQDNNYFDIFLTLKKHNE